MPRISSFPTLFEETFSISSSDLKKWGFIKPDEIIRKWITLRKYRGITRMFQIRVNNKDGPYLQLIYPQNGRHLNYIIEMVSVPSNLGEGLVWYFICPLTRKRCRKLYFLNGMFAHREAGKGCFYEGQTVSKKRKLSFKLLQLDSKAWDAEEAIFDKFFKRHYAGKPTKRYLKYAELIDISLSSDEIYPGWWRNA